MIKTGECNLCFVQFKENGHDKFNWKVEKHYYTEHPMEHGALKVISSRLTEETKKLKLENPQFYLGIGGHWQINIQKLLKEVKVG